MTMLGCESRDLRTRDVMELVTLDYVIVDYFKMIGLIRLFVSTLELMTTRNGRSPPYAYGAGHGPTSLKTQSNLTFYYQSISN